MDYVTRIHLKRDNHIRKKLIDFCLNNSDQYLAIGWSRLSKDIKDNDFNEYYERIKKERGRANPAINVFRDTKIDDLFWTRDLSGDYWICKVKSPAKVVCNTNLDIGSILPVEAFNVGMQVPGQIKSSFNRPRGSTIERIRDKSIIEYSKLLFNKFSKNNYFEIKPFRGGLLDNLPEFDLEELVISYLQIKENYYVLSNSIANKSTTIKIECEMISREIDNPRKAVVQVKGKKAKELDALEFKQYVDEGYLVYLYAPRVINLDNIENIVRIGDNDLLDFYEKYKLILPASITRWKDLFSESD